uniref:Sulfhydryl oxidase n=1 Tax=Blastobotrys adeninivorans TaxID=409370 RepID=A0A060T9J4_BLAAD
MTGTEGSVTYINGRRVILDKDGKPCRSCNSLLDFQAAMGKGAGSGAGSSSGKGSVAGMAGMATMAGMTASGSAAAAPSSQPECPPDVVELGRSTWTFLHTMAANYPKQADSTQQAEMKSFLNIFSNVYPCWWCAKDLRTWMDKEENKPRVGGRDELSNWLCDAHNEVNKKLGKPEFDCKQWRERWKDGWKDGRCD